MCLPKSRNDGVELTYSDLIDRTVADFGDHAGLDRPKVIRWLAQFPDSTIATGAKALSEVKYFARSDLEGMSKELADMVYGQYPTVNPDLIYFVPIGLPSSGSFVVARHLRSIGVPRGRIVDLLSLTQLSPDDVEVIVFIDDFSGTGSTFQNWWYVIEQLVLPINATNVSGVLVLNHRANVALDEIFDMVLSVQFLDESSDIFHTSCGAFTEEEKDVLLTTCRETGAREGLVKGWGDCGVLLAFVHGCPNNSLPILWYQSDRWESLFNRHNP